MFSMISYHSSAGIPSLSSYESSDLIFMVCSNDDHMATESRIETDNTSTRGSSIKNEHQRAEVILWLPSLDLSVIIFQNGSMLTRVRALKTLNLYFRSSWK